MALQQLRAPCRPGAAHRHPAPGPEAVQTLRSAIADAYLGKVDERAVKTAIAQLERFVDSALTAAFWEALTAPHSFRPERTLLLRQRMRAIEDALYPEHQVAVDRIERRFGARYRALMASVLA
jgi:hypothetical protein